MIRKAYRVFGSGKGCFAETSTVAGFVVRTDTPRKDGGTDRAAEPVETLLSALIGCEQATAHFVGRMLRHKIERIEFDLEAYRDQRGSMSRPVTEDPPEFPARLLRVWGSARVVPISDMTPEDVRKLGVIVHHRCPIASMLVASGCEMDVEWKLY